MARTMNFFFQILFAPSRCAIVTFKTLSCSLHSQDFISPHPQTLICVFPVNLPLLLSLARSATKFRVVLKSYNAHVPLKYFAMKMQLLSVKKPEELVGLK